MKYFKQILLLSIASTLVLSVFAEESKEKEIGITEYLDSTAPLHLKFINESNDTVVLGDLIDKPTIFSFVYFDCPGLCSPLLNGISEVVEKTDLELGKDYQVITISFNVSDTPEKAIEKKKNFANNISKEKSQYWYYLTGDSASIREVTDAFGYYYKKQGLDYMHGSAIMAVSPSGKITRYLYGLTFLPFDFKMSILEASKGISRPSISRVYEYCFSYDPVGKRYVFDVMKISATIIILLSLGLFIYLIVKRRNK